MGYKVLILGKNGMLGHAVEKVFAQETRFDCLALGRENFDPTIQGNDFLYNKCGLVEDTWVINCIGHIKPRWKTQGNPLIDNDAMGIYINSYWPRTLANLCESKKAKLIHITTDCVFSGKSMGRDTYNYYNEKDFHDATDVYGRSKSLGEPPNCLNIRTSIIGPETNHNYSLMSWLMSQQGKTIEGYVNHYWNGMTTKNLARIMRDIILGDHYLKGTFHMMSRGAVNKYDLLKSIKDKFHLNVAICATQASETVDRTLGSLFNELPVWYLPIDQQLEDLRTWTI